MYMPDHFVSDVGLKATADGERGYYISGYISTDEVDVNKEVVPRAAMEKMVAQLNQGAMKLDIEHETFLGKADIPIGRITEASLVNHEGKNKILVKAVLNKDHARFPEVWQSIQNRFIDAFSIAYKVRDAATQVVNGVQARVLKSVDLLNVALTGNPVNRGCTMSEAFVKSLSQAEVTIVTQENTAPSVDIIAEMKSLHDAHLKSFTETLETMTAELKSLREENKVAQAALAELKAVIEAPQLKSIVTPETPVKEAPRSPLGLIH